MFFATASWLWVVEKKEKMKGTFESDKQLIKICYIRVVTK